MKLSAAVNVLSSAIFIVIIGTFLCVDVAFRFVPSVLNVQPNPMFYGNVLGNLKPNVRASAYWHPRIPYSYSTDGNGFRRNGIVLHDEPEGLILCMGDSYTFGVSTSDAAAFPAELEADLNKKSGPRFPVFRVINAGLPGVGIEDNYLYYIDKARKIKPNLVILQYDIYEMARLIKPYSYKFSARGNTYALLKDWPMTDEVMRSLRKYLEENWLYRMVSEAFFDRAVYQEDVENVKLANDVLGVRGSKGTDAIDAVLAEDVKILDENNFHVIEPLWQRYLEVLLKFKKAVEADGGDFLLVIVPHHMQMNSFDNAPSAAIAPFCEKNGIKYVDMTKMFRSLAVDDGVELFLQPFDNHCNASGNAIIAEQISKRIVTVPNKKAWNISFSQNLPGFMYSKPEKINVMFDAQGVPSVMENDYLEMVGYKKSNLRVMPEGDGTIQYITSGGEQKTTGSATLQLRLKQPVDKIGTVFFPHLLGGDNKANSFAVTISSESEGATYSTDGSNAPDRWKDLENMHNLMFKPSKVLSDTFTIDFKFVRNGGFIFDNKSRDAFRRFDIIVYPHQES